LAKAASEISVCSSADDLRAVASLNHLVGESQKNWEYNEFPIDTLAPQSREKERR
jgi:hypothetical protein